MPCRTDGDCDSRRSVRELLKCGTDALRNAGVDTPILDAEMLLSLATGHPRIHLIAHPQEPVAAETANIYLDYIHRRTDRTPLAYITGEREFHGLRFYVGSGVLVPRSETEVLVDFAVERLSGIEKPIVADVGTGSGIIALSVAVSAPNARIYASDVSDAALINASRNAEMLGVAGSVVFEKGSLLEPFGNMLFDVILSNPPYIPTEEIGSLQPEISRWEPREALDGGADGLDAYRALVPESYDKLAKGGFLAVEVGMGQSDRVSGIFADYGFRDLDTIKDLAGIERVVFGCR